MRASEYTFIFRMRPNTPFRNKLLCQLLGRLGRNGFQLRWRFGTLGGRFGSTSLSALPIQPIWLIFEVNGLDSHRCLAGSSKTAPRILIFSIAMVAHYSFDVKNIWAPVFLKHIHNSFIVTVCKHQTILLSLSVL